MMTVTSFLLEHWMLSGLLSLAVLAFFWNEWRQRLPRGVATLDPEQVIQAVNYQHGQIIDIREAAAFKIEHIVGAISIPFSQLLAQKALWARYKEKPVIVVCEAGVQSWKAVRQLRQEGLELLAVLAGGIQAWKRANLPVVRPYSANQP